MCIRVEWTVTTMDRLSATIGSGVCAAQDRSPELAGSWFAKLAVGYRQEEPRTTARGTARYDLLASISSAQAGSLTLSASTWSEASSYGSKAEA